MRMQRPLVCLIASLLLSGIVSCSSGGGNSANSSEAAITNPTISTNRFLTIVLKKHDDKLVHTKTWSRETSQNIQLKPHFSGDHAIIVEDQDDNVQFITFFSIPDTVRARRIDPQTGEHIKSTVDMSMLPITLQVPINEKTDEIYILNSDKERVLDISVDWTYFPKQNNSSQKKQQNKIFDYIDPANEHITFTEYRRYMGESALSDPTILLSINDALNFITSNNIINSINEIVYVRSSPDHLLDYRGFYLDSRIYIIGENYIDLTPLEQAALLAHESAHCYIDYLEANAREFSYEIDDLLDGSIHDFNTYMDHEWTEITRHWYDIQKAYRELRAVNSCDGELFIEEEYEYRDALSPAIADTTPTVYRQYHHGFVTPYASTDVHEDIAETYEKALFDTRTFAAQIARGNVYDNKLAYLSEMKLISIDEYENILSIADELTQHPIILFAFRHTGVQCVSLSFELNGDTIPPSFHGSGRKSIEMTDYTGNLYASSNELYLETSINEDDDHDDIEVFDIQLESPRPIDPGTGCNSTHVFLNAPEAIHLGNDNCPDDPHCDSYSALQGTSYTWDF